ncbi:beta strand repeat-containing protein, partial [Lactiplantibacillus plantarum]|uniref:beta strand repeat-containing protein n=1 Tax=Lactiplantibacillus plantarum TaxID=1590 RepID=UPI0021A74E26
MAESNATQVILTDDGIKIINAQNTADNAASGVANLNDPNLMSVIEKQTQAAQYAGLTSQYNVVLARAKEASISTTDLTTAYANLDTFMTAILTDTTKASAVNRDSYQDLTYAYNAALSSVQTALSDSFNTDIDNMQSSVSVASQAASSATIVASQATVTGNNASQVASQAITAASQAQDTGDNATSVANNASQAASSAVLAGSTATVNANKALTAASQAQDTGNNATSVANNASQAASSAILAGSTAAVSASQASADYQTLSAGVKDGSVVHITTETVIDKGVIGTAEIANGAITNAQIGNEAVGTAQIGDLAVGTAQIGDGAITNAKIGKLAVGTAQIANGAITNAQIGSLAVGTAEIKDAAINSAKIADLAVGTAQIGDGAITNAKIGSLAVGTAQIANAAITDAQVGNVSANKLTAGTIDFNTITGKNINASNITTGTLSTDRLNVGKLSALSANLGDVTTGSLKGVDIVANTFSTPNGSFTTDENGAITANNMALIGGTLSSPTINASTINGSTINGTTINGGTTSTNAYNVNKLAPLTIASDGTLTSTNYLNSIGAQAQIIDGELSTKYREFTPLSGTNYTAREVALGDGLLTLTDGYTTTADTGFNLTPIISGQAILSAEYGLQLYGPTQQIYFSGTDSTGVTGISLNSYGNVIGNTSATWWRIVSNSGSNVANFGIDTAGSNVIQFNRELDIGNFHINTGHTFTSADNGAIHFAMGKGGAADIYAGAVNYTSLVKSSLLSVKKDVQKADTSYWAQLVNSIDLATYQYKSDDNTSQIRLSSIVDDVNDTKQWRLPDIFINRDEDGKLNGVDDSVLLNATLATVQEQQKE